MTDDIWRIYSASSRGEWHIGAGINRHNDGPDRKVCVVTSSEEDAEAICKAHNASLTSRQSEPGKPRAEVEASEEMETALRRFLDTRWTEDESTQIDKDSGIQLELSFVAGWEAALLARAPRIRAEKPEESICHCGQPMKEHFFTSDHMAVEMERQQYENAMRHGIELQAERDRLREALVEAAKSLDTLAHACAQTGFEDFIDIRGYANSRARVAREALLRAETPKPAPKPEGRIDLDHGIEKGTIVVPNHWRKMNRKPAASDGKGEP